MKKSVLFSTIAMIVVVIVALSTATFAWFSASTESTATGTITATGDSGLSVVVNNTQLYDDDTAAVFSGNTLLTATLDNSGTPVAGIRGGLWAPVGSLINANYRTTSNGANNVKLAGDPAGFVSGKESGSDFVPNYLAAAVPTISPDVIRLKNASASPISTTLTIVVYASASDDASLIAATGLSFYIGYNTNASTPVYTAYTTHYSYLKNSSSLVDEDEDGKADPIAKSTSFQAVTAAETVSGTTSTIVTSSYNHGSAKNNEAGYGFTTGAGTTGTYGLTSDYKYYTMTIDLGSITANEAINFYVYTWLDGAYLDDAASGATVNVIYSFGETD